MELSGAYVDKGTVAVGENATVLFQYGSSFVNGVLENHGLVQAESGFIGNGVTVSLMGGTLRAPTVEIRDGALNGSGTIDGNLIVGMGTTISPGFSPGEVVITGDFFLDADSVLLLEVASSDAYDVLNSLGGATLSGTINLAFLAGYVPTEGESYSFITAASGADFSGVQAFNVSGLPDGYEFHTDFGDHNLVFYADGPARVPEPQTYMMLIIGLFLVHIAARRRRVPVY